MPFIKTEKIKIAFAVLSFGLMTSLIPLPTMGMDDSSNVSVHYDSKYFSDLCYCSDRLDKALKADTFLVNKQDENGDTLLHHLAKGGLMFKETTLRPLFNILFSHHPNTLVFNRDDLTPLHIAAECCHDKVSVYFVFPEILKYSVQNKFNPNPANKNGITPHHIASTKTYTYGYYEIKSPIGVFADKHFIPDPSIIDWNAKTMYGQTPLHWAVLSGNYENTTVLIQSGVDVILFFNDPEESERSKLPLAILVDELKGTFYQGQYDPFLQFLGNIAEGEN